MPQSTPPKESAAPDSLTTPLFFHSLSASTERPEQKALRVVSAFPQLAQDSPVLCLHLALNSLYWSNGSPQIQLIVVQAIRNLPFIPKDHSWETLTQNVLRYLERSRTDSHEDSPTRITKVPPNRQAITFTPQNTDGAGLSPQVERKDTPSPLAYSRFWSLIEQLDLPSSHMEFAEDFSDSDTGLVYFCFFLLQTKRIDLAHFSALKEQLKKIVFESPKSIKAQVRFIELFENSSFSHRS